MMGVKTGYAHCIDLLKLHGYYVASRAGLNQSLPLFSGRDWLIHRKNAIAFLEGKPMTESNKMRYYLTTMTFLRQEGSVQRLEIFNSYDIADSREAAVDRATESPKARDYFHQGWTLPTVISHPVPDYVRGGEL